MAIRKYLTVVGVVTACCLGSGRGDAQDVPLLGTVTTAKCTFTSVLTGTWQNGKPVGAVKPANLTMEFESINLDEGTAVVIANKGGDAGKSDLFVRLARATLHFVQVFTDGPMYTTTIFPVETKAGRLQAVHTRHEFTAGIAVPGYTWQPERSYGDCEVHK